MASTIEAGQLVYNFISKGFAELKHNLTYVERSIKALEGVVGLADPVGVKQFNTEIEITGAYIGRIFIPIMEDLKEVVKSVGEWFAAMSPSQRQVVRDLTVYGAAAAIAVIAVGALSSAILVYSVAMVKATVATVAFLMSNPVGWALAAAGAIAVLMTGVIAFGAIVGVAGQKGATWAEKFGAAWAAVWTFVGPILEKFSEVLRRVGAIGSVIFDSLLEVLGQFGIDWGALWKFVQQGFIQFLDTFVVAVKFFAVVIAQMVNQTITAIKTMVGLLQEAVSIAQKVAAVTDITGNTSKGLKTTAALLDVINSKLVNVKGIEIGDFIGKLNKADADAAKPPEIRSDQGHQVAKPAVIRDIADVFKHAQQAADETTDPSLKLLMVQNDLARDQNQLLKDVVTNTSKLGLR